MDEDAWKKYLESWGANVGDAKNDEWAKWQELLLLKYQDLVNKEKIETGGHVKVTETYRRGQLMGLIREIKEIPTQFHVKVVDVIMDDMFHYGPIEPLMQRDDVSDVQIFIPFDDADPQVIKYADRKGRHYYKGKGFRNYRHAATWLNRHLSQMGDRYDPAEVSKDATFPNGERMHIISGCSGYSVFDPNAADPKERYRFVPCMIITIRRFLRSFTVDELTNWLEGTDQPPTFDDLKVVNRNYVRKTRYFKYAGGMADPATMNYLQIMVKLAKNHLLSGGTGCHEADAPILMFDGSIKRAADIQVGDQLMGPDSTPRNVLSLHQGIDEMVRIVPNKGEPFVVNADHILSLVSTPKYYGGERRVINISVRDYREQKINFKTHHNLYRAAVEFEEKELPVDPYFLGLLLGDGILAGGSIGISNPDEEIIDRIHKEAEIRGLHVTKSGQGTSATYRLCSDIGGEYHRNNLIYDIESLGLRGTRSGDKFIPDIYKTASRKQRLELLAGLIDTDGTLCVSGFGYITKSLQLAQDIQFLCRSLGFFAQIKPCSMSCSWGEEKEKSYTGTYYRLFISGDCDLIPTRVARKKSPPRKRNKDVLVTGFHTESIGIGEYYGFEVDGDHLYLDGQFTVIHNCGKTTLANALTGAIPSGTALIVIEESAEMQPQNQGHVIRLQEVKGVFDLSEAMKATLRMFPDRIFIAEVRDALAYTFIRAVQSGHDGSSTTIHADSCQSAIDVLINFAANHPSHPERDMLRDVVYRRIHTVLHAKSVKDGPNQINRFFDEVVQLLPGGGIHPVMQFHQVGIKNDGEVAGYFEFHGPTDEFVQEMFAAGIPIPESWGWEVV